MAFNKKQNIIEFNSYEKKSIINGLKCEFKGATLRPARFNFHQTTSLKEACLLAKQGAVPMAGGQALIQDMRLRNRAPAEIIDLGQIPEISQKISFKHDSLIIGAKVTIAELLEDKNVLERLPILSEAARRLGDVQIRNFATVVGNVCWSDPRANLAVALLACQAKITVMEDNGTPTKIDLEDFFSGFRENILDGRIATEIEVPLSEKNVGAYLEFSRQPQDLALVNIAMVTTLSENRNFIAIGGIFNRPLRLKISKRDLTAEIIRKIENNNSPLLDDQFASPSHKIDILRALLKKLFLRLQ